MNLKFLPIVLVAAVVLVAGCAQKQQPTPTPVAATPDITITSPAAGATVSGPDVTIGFSVSNLKIVAPPADGKNVAGQGHLHGYLDDGQYIPIADTSYVAKGLSAGKHKFRLELQNNDHSLLSPKVMKEVEFTVGSAAAGGTTPAITFTTPTEGATVSGPDVTLTFSVSNFQVVGPPEDGKNVDGKGHFHGYVDGGDYIPIASNSYTAKGLTSGKHTFKLDLRNNDHSAYSPAVMKEITFTVGSTKTFTMDINHDAGYVVKDSSGASVSEIKVSTGDTVKLLGTSTPLSHNHGVAIDALNVNVEIKALPGTTPQELTFTAPTAGTYQIYCKTCLGGALGAHPWHKINLVVQ